MFTLFENTSEAVKNLSSLLNGLGIKLLSKSGGDFSALLRQTIAGNASVNQSAPFLNLSVNSEIQPPENQSFADISNTTTAQMPLPGTKISEAGTQSQNAAHFVVKIAKPVQLSLKPPNGNEVIPFEVESVYLPETGKISFVEQSGAAKNSTEPVSSLIPENRTTLVLLKENGQVLAKITGHFPAQDTDSQPGRNDVPAPSTPGGMGLLQFAAAENGAVYLPNSSAANSAPVNVMETESPPNVPRNFAVFVNLTEKTGSVDATSTPVLAAKPVPELKAGFSADTGIFPSEPPQAVPNKLSPRVSPASAETPALTETRVNVAQREAPNPEFQVEGNAALTEGQIDVSGKTFTPVMLPAGETIPKTPTGEVPPANVAAKTANPAAIAPASAPPKSGKDIPFQPKGSKSAEKLSGKSSKLSQPAVPEPGASPAIEIHHYQNVNHSVLKNENLSRVFPETAIKSKAPAPQSFRKTPTAPPLNHQEMAPTAAVHASSEKPVSFQHRPHSATAVPEPAIFSFSEVQPKGPEPGMAPVFKNESLTKFWHWLNSQVLRSLPGQVGGSEKNPSTGHQLIKESGDHLNPEPGSSVKPLLPFASKAVQTGAMPPGFPELSMKELITTLAARQKNGHLKQKNTAKTKAAEVNSGIEEAPLLNSLFPEKPKPTAEKLPQMIPLFPNRTKGKKAAAVAHSANGETQPFDTPMAAAKGNGANSPKFGLDQHFRNDFATLTAAGNSASAKTNSLRGAKIARVRPHQLPEFLQSTVGNFIKHFDLNLQPAVQNIFLQLEPESLGMVRIRLELKDNMLRGHLEASRPEALQILHQQQPRLINKLEDLGIQVQQLDLNLNQNMDSPAAFAHHRPDGGGKRGFHSAESEFGNPENSLDEPVLNIPKWLGYNTIDLMA